MKKIVSYIREVMKKIYKINNKIKYKMKCGLKDYPNHKFIFSSIFYKLFSIQSSLFFLKGLSN